MPKELREDLKKGWTVAPIYTVLEFTLKTDADPSARTILFFHPTFYY